MYTSRLLYPFIFGWTLRLLPYIHYCEQCCYEHWCVYIYFLASLVAQLVKSPPAMQETWVQSLGIFYCLNYENETNLQETWKI